MDFTAEESTNNDRNSKRGKKLFSNRRLANTSRKKDVVPESPNGTGSHGYQENEEITYEGRVMDNGINDSDDEVFVDTCRCCGSSKKPKRDPHLVNGQSTGSSTSRRQRLHQQQRKERQKRFRLQGLCLRLRLFFCCKRKRKNTSSSLLEHQISRDSGDINLLYEDEPFRKRVCRGFLTCLYTILAAVAVFATYSMVNDLVVSVRNPVRSIHYKKTNIYDAPGIAVYPGGAKFLACGHYYNNVVTSKVKLEQLDLKNRNCSYTALTYYDPHYNTTPRDVIVFSGPTSFIDREAIFLHFSLEDEKRDFFTVSYFVFNNYNKFQNSTKGTQIDILLDYHRYVPTFALSSGLRMWIKLVMSETFLLDGTHHTNFDVEYSVVRFHDRRSKEDQKEHLFFIFFEWKNNIVEQSTLLYTTTPWSVLAGLCGVFLMLHRFYLLAQTSYKRVQKDKRRRTLRKETLRKIRESQRTDGSFSEGPVNI